MQFYYKDKRYGVVFETKELMIGFYEYYNENSLQHYKTKEEFIANANIEGVLLKDIWGDVKNADYMQCD